MRDGVPQQMESFGSSWLNTHCALNRTGSKNCNAVQWTTLYSNHPKIGHFLSEEYLYGPISFETICTMAHRRLERRREKPISFDLIPTMGPFFYSNNYNGSHFWNTSNGRFCFGTISAMGTFSWKWIWIVTPTVGKISTMSQFLSERHLQWTSSFLEISIIEFSFRTIYTEGVNMFWTHICNSQFNR
jgi:hypothetical protein